MAKAQALAMELANTPFGCLKQEKFRILALVRSLHSKENHHSRSPYAILFQEPRTEYHRACQP